MKREDALAKIKGILAKRNPALAAKIRSAIDLSTLDRQIRLEIIDCLSDEFIESGLRPDSEPNKYGLEIEVLIDSCGLTRDK